MAITKKQVKDFDEQADPSPADLLMIQENSGDVYKRSSVEDVVRAGTSEILDDIADLDQTISDPPTQAEVQAISNKVDAIIAALKQTSS